MVKNLNDKNLLKNLLKAVKELTELLKTTNVRKNIGDTTNVSYTHLTLPTKA